MWYTSLTFSECQSKWETLWKKIANRGVPILAVFDFSEDSEWAAKTAGDSLCKNPNVCYSDRIKIKCICEMSNLPNRPSEN